ncbi:MAG: CoA ester lyase [Jatrophihabitans sp.]|nr:MAG: CoA ester lyase [Jatrophihabitans sp.]
MIRPLRSVLYMPGSNARALEKARTIPADALILDLEDAVAPDAKADARARVCAAAASGEYGARVVAIRTNGLDTRWHGDDVAAAAQAGPDAIVVPKVNSADEVRSIERSLAAAGAPEHTELWAMIETPRAILDVASIAAASQRLTTFVMGTNDLLSELRALHAPGRPALVTALARAVLAARAHGKAILDGVYNDVRDSEGFAEECRQGRVMGFDGKTLIHPGQVEPCNEAFAPSARDVEHARAVVEAFDAALREGKGVATVNGRLIENLHVTDARRVLGFAEAIGLSGRD